MIRKTPYKRSTLLFSQKIHRHQAEKKGGWQIEKIAQCAKLLPNVGGHLSIGQQLCQTNELGNFLTQNCLVTTPFIFSHCKKKRTPIIRANVQNEVRQK